jgi:hypothetical protein
MDAVLVERAQLELNRAHQCLNELATTKHVGEIAFRWANFLVTFERIFTRLEAAAGGKGNAWFGKVEQYRRTDPLLSYLRHARNVDEHGIKAVAEPMPGRIGEVSAEPMDMERPEAGMRVFLEVRDPHLALVDVKDRGVIYPVPTSFRGDPISAAHPMNVGLLGLSYADEVLTEARRQV